MTSAVPASADGLPPPPIEDFDAWLGALTHLDALTELGVLFLCVAMAWFGVRFTRRAMDATNPKSIWFGRKIYDGVMFPLVLLCLAYAARAALMRWMPVVVLKIAIPVLVALVAIRVGVKVLQVAFGNTPAVRALERTISWAAWLAMVLWVSGLLPILLVELDQIRWSVGGSTLSLRTLIEGALTAGAVLLITLWISAGIEARLLRTASGSQLSLRKAISNATRALLVLVGLLLALSAVGIDLTALSVLGGAIGVGIGFGLQKLAANYVSGFVMLAERSVRIGDSVRIDGFEGAITDINARYSVVRSLSGRESIVPNELFVTQRVENLSLADKLVWQSTVVSVAYDSDVELVTRLLEEAALAQPRVLKKPEPAAALSAFGADGLEFTLGYWIEDPQNGQLNLRSLVNHAVLKALREHHIVIPYPQRVLHMDTAPIVAASGSTGTPV
jgi:small-conductance mechanosensitive channel